MAILNTASSIVDYLKSKGQDSSFNTRKSLYESSGLKDAFGDYRGSAEQNVTLLKKVQGTPAPVASSSPAVPGGVTYNPANNISTTEPQPTIKDVIAETTPSTISSAFDLEKSDTDKALEAEKKGLTFDLAADTTRASETVGRDVATLKRTAEEGISDLSLKGKELTTKIGEEAAGFGGAFSGKTKKSQAEVALEVATKQESIKSKLGDSLYNTFTDFEKNYGTKFLESLSIPEAEQFTKLPAPVRGIVMQNYQDAVAKAEEKAQKNALSTLEKLGYTVIGGQIVQTLAGRSAERSEEAAVRAEERLTLAEQAGQRAEEAAQRAEQKFALELSGGGDKTDREARLFDEISSEAVTDLAAHVGGDGYIDSGVYMSYRNKVKEKAPTKLDDFDKNFALKLNPADAIKLGINQAKYRAANKLDVLIEALQK